MFWIERSKDFSLMPSVGSTSMLRMARVELSKAEPSATDILSEHEGLAPSQIMPVRVFIMFLMEYPTCSNVPPCKSTKPADAPIDAFTKPHNADSLPIYCFT